MTVRGEGDGADERPPPASGRSANFACEKSSTDAAIVDCRAALLRFDALGVDAHRPPVLRCGWSRAMRSSRVNSVALPRGVGGAADALVCLGEREVRPGAVGCLLDRRLEVLDPRVVISRLDQRLAERPLGRRSCRARPRRPAAPREGRLGGLALLQVLVGDLHQRLGVVRAGSAALS